MNTQLRSALVGAATAIALLAVPGAALASQGSSTDTPPGMSVMMNAPGHEHLMSSPGHDHVMTSPGHQAMMD